MVTIADDDGKRYKCRAILDLKSQLGLMTKKVCSDFTSNSETDQSDHYHEIDIKSKHTFLL